jgi:hypothetical protein
LIAFQRINASSASRSIKAHKWNGDAGGVDAVLQSVRCDDARFAAKHAQRFKS